jgi:hypothetical protein
VRAQATKEVNALLETTHARVAAIHSDADKNADAKEALQNLMAQL